MFLFFKLNYIFIIMKEEKKCISIGNNFSSDYSIMDE